MINLLPPQQKEELFQERRHRLVLISGILGIVFLITLSLVLFAVEVYISGRAQGGEITLPAQLQNQEAAIVEMNENLRGLQIFYASQPDFAGFLEEISRILPNNVSLTSLSLTSPKKDEGFSVSLRGLSPTRDLLFQLKRNLESEKTFKEIDFPPSNWAKPKDVEFSVSFKVAL